MLASTSTATTGTATLRSNRSVHSVDPREHHRVGGEVERQRRLDDVALERGVQQTAVSGLSAALNPAAAIGVLDVELDLALPQVLAFEGIVLRSLVGDAQTSPLAAESSARARRRADRSSRWCG
jgi:hypothetical protein